VLGQQMINGLRTIERHPRDVQASDPSLPRTGGQLQLTPGDVVLTSLRKHPVREHVEVRLFNPHDAVRNETLRFDADVEAAFITDFEGLCLEELPLQSGEVAVELGPKKIVTIGLTLRAK